MSVPETTLRPITPARIQTLMDRFAGLTIVIAGDLMLDHFIFGRVHRISPEAPVPVIEFEREDFRVGGAGNVAHNVRTLGGSTEVIGTIGRDEHGIRVKDALQAGGVTTAGVLVDDSRSTTRKVRIVTSRSQQVARIDYEQDAEVQHDVESVLIGALERAALSAHALVISDYLKGVVTRRLVARAISIGRDRSIPVLIDPKVPHLDYYRGATLLTPNNLEAETATHTRIHTDADAKIAARAIRDRFACQTVLITRGESGMWLLDDKVEGRLAAVTREVADVTGAGDTVIATLALTLAAGGDALEAATLANAAAGVAVGKFGPSAVTSAELRSALT